jgi:uncharacterized damage-inducible protein DinB
MFRHLQDVAAIWTMEAGKTLQVFDAIPDGSAFAAITAQHRDLRRLAWHLCESLAEMPANMGLHLEGFPGEPWKTPAPDSMAEIRKVYTALSESFLASLKGLNDMALAMTYPYYGETWTGAFALWVMVTHQTHHRGQMTVVMRQAGLKVPGVYGPVLEDWAGMGLPVPMV